MAELNLENWNEEHREFLTNYAKTLIHDHELAEDMVQKTFISAWKHRNDFEGRSSIRTYLSVIMKREIIDYTRTRWGRGAVVGLSQLSHPDRAFVDGWVEARADPRSCDPGRVTETKDTMKYIAETIARVPNERLRQVAILGFLQGLSAKAGGEVLGVTPHYFNQMKSEVRSVLKVFLADFR